MAKKINEYYIKTHETIDIDDNGCDENTYYIMGEISKNGNEWEECMFIWDGNNNPIKKHKKKIDNVIVKNIPPVYKNIITAFTYKNIPIFVDWFFEENFVKNNIVDHEEVDAARQQIQAVQRGYIEC